MPTLNAGPFSTTMSGSARGTSNAPAWMPRGRDYRDGERPRSISPNHRRDPYTTATGTSTGTRGVRMSTSSSNRVSVVDEIALSKRAGLTRNQRKRLAMHGASPSRTDAAKSPQLSRRGTPPRYGRVGHTSRNSDTEERALVEERRRDCCLPVSFITGGAASHPTRQSTPNARQLCISHVPHGMNEEELHDFFMHAIEKALVEKMEEDPILSVYINHEKHLYFLDFKTAEMTTACLALDGIEIMGGGKIKVKRPNDYNPVMEPLIPASSLPQLDISRLGIISDTVPDGPNKLYVGGLYRSFDEGQVLDLLQAYGKVRAFSLVKDERDSRYSKGYCFVEYMDPKVTPIATMGLNGMDLGGGKSLTARLAAGARQSIPAPAPSKMNPAVSDRTIVNDNDVEKVANAALGLSETPAPPALVGTGPLGPLTQIIPPATMVPDLTLSQAPCSKEEVDSDKEEEYQEEEEDPKNVGQFRNEVLAANSSQGKEESKKSSEEESDEESDKEKESDDETAEVVKEDNIVKHGQQEPEESHKDLIDSSDDDVTAEVIKAPRADHVDAAMTAVTHRQERDDSSDEESDKHSKEYSDYKTAEVVKEESDDIVVAPAAKNGQEPGESSDEESDEDSHKEPEESPYEWTAEVLKEESDDDHINAVVTAAMHGQETEESSDEEPAQEPNKEPVESPDDETSERGKAESDDNRVVPAAKRSDNEEESDKEQEDSQDDEMEEAVAGVSDDDYSVDEVVQAVKRNDCPKVVGSRVYARWKKSDDWYFGIITQKTKKRGHSRYSYSIRFDDGDFLEDAPWQDVWTVESYETIFGQEAPPLPRHLQDMSTPAEQVARPLPNQSREMWTPAELYRNRCRSCVLCRKPKCGKCTTCRSESRPPKREVCLQKMCCEIHVAYKAQPAIGYPPGWTFYFDASDTPESGLVLTTPKGRRFRSTAAASGFIKKEAYQNVDEFYEHVGLTVKPLKHTKEQVGLTPEPLKHSKGVISRLRDLYRRRCQDCVQCQKDDCGLCCSCLGNEANPNHRKNMVCLQKMCCRIDELEKTLPAPGFPSGWEFVLLESTSGQGIDLFIIGPRGNRYKSVETAKGHCKIMLQDFPNLARDFYRYIGVDHDQVNKMAVKKLTNHAQINKNAVNKKLTVLQLLHKRRCTKCAQCLLPDCTKCDSCRNRRSSTELPEVCIQNICCNIPEKEKVLPVPGYPDGFWFFVDQPKGKNDTVLDRLVLINHTGFRFHSVETLRNRYHVALKEISHEALFRYIGAESGDGGSAEEANESYQVGSVVYCVWPSGQWYQATIKRKWTEKGIPHYDVLSNDGYRLQNIQNCQIMSVSAYLDEKPSRPGHTRKREGQGSSDQNSSSKRARRESAEAPNDISNSRPAPYTLVELRRNGCKRCEFCTKPDCKQCYSCVRNRDKHPTSKNKEVCLRKMCCNIQADMKAQEAVGFPPGWRFYFGKPPKTLVYRTREVDIVGLHLVAPSGRTFYSVQSAINRNSRSLKDSEKLCNAFYAHVGSASEGIHLHQDLVGRRFVQEWTDLQGRDKIVYGSVTGLNPDPKDGNETVVSVEYSEVSRLDANASCDFCGSAVPSTKRLTLSLALGAIQSLERRRNPQGRMDDIQFNGQVIPWAWYTPEQRHEELLDVGHGLKLPQLTLTLRGFRLAFSVKESTIPDAGFGVFVKVDDLLGGSFGKDASFVLQAGDFLDLGRYAPFRPEDKKRDCVFLVKNYVHSFKCEEWCFETDDGHGYFDITDDLSGDAHTLARSHVLAYVNECSSGQEATVRAENDPEGNVHYLLGVVTPGKKLELPANGLETEIFISYGPAYETVRLRKGYSQLTDTAKEDILQKMKKNGQEYLNEIDNFSVEDVGDCVDYFHGIFDENKDQILDAHKFGLEAGKRAIRVSKRLQERVLSLKQSGEAVPLSLLVSSKALVEQLNRMFGKNRVITYSQGRT